MDLIKPLGTYPPTLNHRDIEVNIYLSHYVSQENHLDTHSLVLSHQDHIQLCSSIVTSYSIYLYLTASHRRIIQSTTSFKLRIKENDTPNSWDSSPHMGAHIVPSSSQRDRHTQLMGFLTPHRGTQHSIFVLERNNTPISWAHPPHGLSHRSTHSVYVLEDVSHSCNHQQYGHRMYLLVYFFLNSSPSI